jgi:hypothetical protein
MSRAGRKRKVSLTRRNGRLDWRQVAEDPSLLTRWSRFRDRVDELGGDPKLTSQSGKMFYLRQLTAVQAEAAERWTRLLVTADHVIYNMARSPVGAPPERFSSGGHEMTPEELKRFLARFYAAQEAVLVAGTPALMALNRLCHDEAGASVMVEAKKGLAQLVLHFRLDDARIP